MAYCENCGNEISDQAAFCPKCGHQKARAAQRVHPAHVPGPRRTEGSAIASLVLGITGLFLCPLILSILAVVFGNQAKRKLVADPSLDGQGMANAGVVLGWIGIALGSIVGLIFLAAMGSARR